MAKIIRNTSPKYHSYDHVKNCSTNGQIDVAKIKASFPVVGAEFETNDKGKIVVKGNLLRVRTLFGDLKQAGFKVRWLPGFGWDKDGVGMPKPREDMRFSIG